MAVSLAENRARLERLWQDFAGGSSEIDGRPEVVDSWRRSATAVATDISSAPSDESAVERWHSDPLALASSSIFDELWQIAIDRDFVAAITDPDGTIVWTAGGRAMRRRGESVHFAPGSRWSEAAIGTNALGLALRRGQPSTVFAAEHYAPIVHDWVCYSAPIIHPVTMQAVGVVDLSTTWKRANPLALSTATALAHCVSLSLGRLQDLPHTVGLRLSTLGSPNVVADGVPVHVTPRQMELLVVLSMYPNGVSLERLHADVYGDSDTSSATVRADLSHLRRLLGGSIGSRPYRLDNVVFVDHLELLSAMRHDDFDYALQLYRGPLLQRSFAPAIEEQRNVIDASLRMAVLQRGTRRHIDQLAQLMPHDSYLRGRRPA